MYQQGIRAGCAHDQLPQAGRLLPAAQPGVSGGRGVGGGVEGEEGEGSVLTAAIPIR